MSLSKVYKESKHFHPEEILPRPSPKESHWPTPPRPQQHFKDAATENGQEDHGFKQDRVISGEQRQAAQIPAGPALSADTTTDGEGFDEAEANSPTLPMETPGVDPLQVERMVEEAYQRGLAEGFQRAESDFGSALQAFLELCRQLDRIRETILQNSVGEMQDLVLAIAEKIVRTSVLEQDGTLLATVEEAIHGAVRSDEFYIYVNPEDFESVQKKSAELIAGLNGLNNIVIKKDPAIERGGCKVESDNCTVDATMASQFEIIREQVKGRLKST